ncbi:MAG: FtsX-like permease family protein, partial [Longimicrobiales bacterium]|nr:FtsX-like permease family protein [Longimicrobiales bacterium]
MASDVETHRADFLARIGRNHLELRDRLRADGSVRRVAMGSHVPGVPHSDQAIEIQGRNTSDPRRERALAGRVHVDFFRDLGIEVLSGRGFSQADVEAGPVPIPPWAVPRVRRGEAPRPAVVVNDQFVDSILGGGEAVGLQLRYAFRESELAGTETGVEDYNVWYEIVGVVETFGTNVQNPARGAAVYHPVAASEVHPMRFIIEVADEPSAFIPRLRQVAAGVDPELVVRNPVTLREVVERQRTQSTLVTLFIVLLSTTGVILASTGLYALVSFTVSQRTREIGIRTALGAGARNVVATVARRAFQQLAAGIVLGCLAGWGLLSLMADESEFAVPSVPGLLSGVCIAVFLVASLACLKPTLRGLRIEPTEALRES